MEYKPLYKRTDVACESGRKKRVQEAKQVRAGKRKDLFQLGRNIKVTPEKSEVLGKVSKSKEYQLRFLAWRKEKENEKKKMKNEPKKKPFISTVSSSFRPTEQVALVDRKFRAPKIRKAPTNVLHEVKPSNKITAKVKSPKNRGNLKSHVTPVKKSSTKKGVISPSAIKKTSQRGNAFESETLKVIESDVENLETPIASQLCFTFNTNHKIVTSTSMKSVLTNRDSIIQKLNDSISPIELYSPTKRDNLSNPEIPSAENDNKENEEGTEHPSCKNKYTHVRTKAQTITKSETPEKCVGQVLNYLSPYVTASRGKVSAKKERLQIEKLYILERTGTPEESVEARRSREAVKYFRKLLNDEIERLDILCNKWVKYKAENENIIDESCVDMINVAVGQTRLLLCKKFQQFSGLIDDCAKCGSNAGDKRSAPILPNDLDGFWSMIKMAIENLDKRFENLDRWLNNNWEDPDAAVTWIPKKKVERRDRVTKPKTNKKYKGNTITKMLLKAKQAYMENKLNNPGVNNDLIVTSTKKLRRSSQMRRKSGSANTPLYTPLLRCSNTFRNAQSSGTKKSFSGTPVLKSNGTPRRTSSTPKSIRSRKSILKTPGTQKRNKSRVLFSEDVQIKSPEEVPSEDSIQHVDIDEHERSTEKMRTDISFD